jgi:hypothetical protein
MSYGSIDMNVLVGKKIKSIEQGSDVIIKCEDGDCFRAYHMQDCCEDVNVYDTIGKLEDIVGEDVLNAYENVSGDWPKDVKVGDYLPESFTWTFHTIVTKKGKFTFRWLGTSNGYYSESVYFGRTECY